MSISRRERENDKPSIAITGLWLRTTGANNEKIELLAEIDGAWRSVVVEHTEDAMISHIVETAGIQAAGPDRLGDDDDVREVPRKKKRVRRTWVPRKKPTKTEKIKARVRAVLRALVLGR